MRGILFAALVAVFSLGPNHVNAGKMSTPVLQSKVLEHGGGCRKSSPPGKCCHMDRKVGIVHCH
ncbi:hypothetical protein FHR98_000218 [Limibacillus halophilus]|uniref:Uncharacterized protein n=1 Tax=Limibacillus halophilus TaxID=1579333 RepID=A0A839SSR3_9PROT|nr:hypothetical protein [Limibacillus halophilus]